MLKMWIIRFGDPIPFGESVSFVCEKGMAFEEDYHQTSFEVTCQVMIVFNSGAFYMFQSQIHLTVTILFPLNQDGSESGSAKGYFLLPEDDEWPNCVRGDPKTKT